MKSEIVVLCEDMAQAQFIRKFLKMRGYTNPRQIIVCPLPGGSGGAGEKYVRDQFPNELKAIRSRQNKGLIVMIDADTGLVEERKRQLDVACDNEGVPRRNQDDPVVVAVPRRNIETWLLNLSGEAWREDSDGRVEKAIKTEGRSETCAERLHELCYRLQRPVEPLSLQDACVQWQRFQRNGS